ncbi:capsular polysaccharide export protein, LipB/KpsS family [Pectobacterium versatile]|uniref:capsular polysaccharide export protein, LipB/KpsS family n=1 Tax=Pectobacterium versatile TaxID=2488639 RepID=UPI001F26F28D|nr:hypothetical protein [Pectobacterium versatile]
MKYLSVIYYDTFARFFCAIEDAVKSKEPDAEFLHLAIFPSGWMYMKTHGRNVQLLPWKVYKHKKSDECITVDEKTLDTVSHYHAVTGERYGKKYKAALSNRALKYINVMGEVVETFKPDVVLFSGDTRIACEALHYYLDRIRYEGKRYFFEQGPNGTTIFDTRGVNANCSFRECAGDLRGEGFTPEQVARPKKFKRNPFYRGSDHALIALLRIFGNVPAEWDSMSLDKYPDSDYQKCLDKGRENTKAGINEILIALQVPDDANNIHHNPLGLGDAELVNMVIQAVEGLAYPIRVREHPLYKRRYSRDMYELVRNSDSLILSDSSLDEDLLNATIVVTVNSMTGLDAYLRRIPVVVLGNAFYDHLLGITRAVDVSSLHNAIEELSNGKLDMLLMERDPSSIFAEMRARYFIPGHYLDDSLDSPAQRIAEILVA